MAKRAGSLEELQALHLLVTRSYTSRIEQDLDDGMFTDAATLSGAAKFLKDNAISADPADKADLRRLQDGLKDAANKREEAAKARRSNMRDILAKASGAE